MGHNLPEVGERIAYYTSDTDVVFARVIAVVFWDLVDIRLDCGAVIRGVRRIITAHMTLSWSESNAGRFMRIS